MIDYKVYGSESEMKIHTETVHYISLHTGISQEKVARLYEIVLRRYKAEARVKDFLAVLVARRVEYLLRKWRSRHFKKLNG